MSPSSYPIARTSASSGRPPSVYRLHHHRFYRHLLFLPFSGTCTQPAEVNSAGPPYFRRENCTMRDCSSSGPLYAQKYTAEIYSPDCSSLGDSFRPRRRRAEQSYSSRNLNWQLFSCLHRRCVCGAGGNFECGETNPEAKPKLNQLNPYAICLSCYYNTILLVLCHLSLQPSVGVLPLQPHHERTKTARQRYYHGGQK